MDNYSIEWKPLIVVLAVGCVLLYWLLARMRANTKYSPKHYLAVPLLTERERVFFERLREAVGEKYVIAPQVVFGAFLKVKNLPWVNKTTARNAVQHNRGDFIICNEKFDVVAVVELDDSTHDKGKQKYKDKRRDELMKAVGVKAIRYRHMPDVARIRADLS
ncbi:TPA: DUF2726 domain-containing protein, partial [Burkholderia multivorans]